jgi:single-strand DNA-binding protein
MSDLNQCQFIGRLGKDPEARFLTNGDAVTNFSIAVGWKTKEKEGTEWVRCVTYGKLAEIAGKYLAKGKQCYVSGRFKTRDYMKDGVKTYATEINVDQLQLLGGKDDGQPKRQAEEFDDAP